MELNQAPQQGGRRRALSTFLVDVSAFTAERDFRILWIGQIASELGRQVIAIAMPYQVYVATGSTLAVGLLSLVQVAALVGLSLPGGAYADTFDRRRLLAGAQTAQVVFCGLLIASAVVPELPIWSVYLASFLLTAASAFARPTQKSALFAVVSRERLRSAVALDQLGGQLAAVAGPALGGVTIAVLGLPAAFTLAALALGSLALAALAIPAGRLPAGRGARGLRAIRDGVGYVRRTPTVFSTMAMDFSAMLFGFPVALFPALALTVFAVGPAGLGALVSSIAVGAVFASVLSGRLSAMRRKGLGVTVLFLIWGAAITLFGLATFSFTLALVFLAIAGAADIGAAVLRASIVQTTIPDEMRGRVSSINSLIATAGPRLGDVEATAVASIASVQLSVVSGGLLCMLATLILARRFPELIRYRD